MPEGAFSRASDERRKWLNESRQKADSNACAQLHIVTCCPHCLMALVEYPHTLTRDFSPELIDSSAVFPWEWFNPLALWVVSTSNFLLSSVIVMDQY